MKKTVLYSVLIIAIGISSFVLLKNSGSKELKNLEITYPFQNAVFPADIVAPTVTWQDSSRGSKKWLIAVSTPEKILFENIETSAKSWRPPTDEWEKMMNQSPGEKITITIKASHNPTVLKDSVKILFSADEVEAPIFYRAVPLPFKFARENLKKVRWHLGSISNEEKPHAVLDNIPVCANCHSFSPDGATIAMDVDARDEKGAYAISSLEENTLFAEDSIINWSDYNEGTFTYGLLSRISPDGRFVVSTLRDSEIFVDRDDLEYSQLFFPFKGILVVYDRIKKEYFELEGANDTLLVQSNPCWSPDGKYIYFTTAKAQHYEESGITGGSVPRPEDMPRYREFENQYLSRDSLIKFNIYKVPFNNGKGGKAVPVQGASHNGKSNYFPKISPDGKWLMFCQAESFMLLQKDSKLFIVPAKGGTPRQMTCNTSNMNSWHSWSPNSKWLVFATKQLSPYTQLFLTHIDENGNDSPPVYLENFSFEEYANNIPEFVNIKYDSNIKINPTFLAEDDFIIRTGEIRENKGDYDGALRAFNEAVEKFPGNQEAYYKRGYVKFHKKQYQPALDDFAKAIEIEKKADYFTMRGLTNLKLNRIDKAIQDLTIASELDPRGFTQMAYLGVGYSRKKEYKKAEDCLEKAIELYDEDPLTHYYLGVAAFKNENWKKADESITTALKMKLPNPQNKPVNEYRGKARMMLGNYNGAIQDLSKAVKLSPANHELYYLLGKAQLESGMQRQAEQSFRKAIQMGSEKAKKLLKDNSLALSKN